MTVSGTALGCVGPDGVDDADGELLGADPLKSTIGSLRICSLPEEMTRAVEVTV